MSNNRSIDGLQRRTSTRPSTTKRTVTKGGVKKTTTIVRKPAVKKVATKPTANRRQIGIDNKKRATKAELKTREELSLDNLNTAVEDEAVKEYLSEVKDIDPTDLIEVSQEEKGKGWFKKSKKKTKKEKTKKKRHIGRWIALIIVLALIGGGYFAYTKLNGIYSQVNGGNIITALLAPDTPLKKDDNGRTNVLIFGTEGYQMDDPNWDGGYLTDSMLMLSFDQDSGDVKAVSLPRDLKSNTCTSTNKINEVFWCQYSNVKKDSDAETKKKYEELGAQKLEEAFEEVLGVDIQYFVHLNWQALIQVVDAVGGIDVVFTYGDQTWDGDEVTIETTDKRGLSDCYGRKCFYTYKNGEVTHLTGEWALAVARTRNAHGGYGAAGGNFSREYFQQKIIEATIKKAKQINLTSDWNAAFGILQAVGDNVRTDFQDSEMKTLMKVANTIDFQTIESISLVDPQDGTSPLLTTGMINGISYVLPTAGVGNYSRIHTYMKKKLSNSYEGEDAQIVVLNGTSAYGVAANEKLNLEDKGFSVKSTNNAPADVSGFDGVKLYQLANDKPKTAAALKELYGVEFENDLPDSLAEYDCDFIVIIGGGYKAKD